MKSLEDIASNMDDLYDALYENKIDLKKAAELANVAGKGLKARQLDLAVRVFLSQKPGAIALATNDVDSA